jgi:catechol 2,3-dioxygenase-like lactoylglutathione lyase family enzyme
MQEDSIGSNVICQIGLVVRDIKRTAKVYADLFGMDVPEVIITDPEESAHTKFRGASTPARARLAFFRMGQVSLELIEPVGEPSTWKEFLDEHGEGVHHIAFQIQGMERVLTFLKGKGIPAIQSGDYTGGRYAYVDSASSIGVIVELLENIA